LRALTLVAVALVILLRDAGVLEFSLPQPLRQVPRSVFDKGLLRASLQFGFELGTGIRTYVTSGAPYLLLLALLLAGVSAPVAVLAGVGFGLGRAVVPLSRLASQHREEWDRRMATQARWLVPACATLSFLAVLALADVTLLA
jgi:hypothetical protein